MKTEKNDIERYISSHPEEVFGKEELPKGHQERFLKKLENVKEHQIGCPVSVGAEMPRKAVIRFPGKVTAALSALVAAAAAMALFLLPPAGKDKGIETIPGNWLTGNENTPEDVYMAYMQKAETIFTGIVQKDLSGMVTTQAESLAFENIPLLEQLPEDMDERQKASVLKEYYGNLLCGLEKISKAAGRE